MGNGYEAIDVGQLHKDGCEYGRALAKDVAYMRGDITELKEDIKELRKSNERIEKQLARGEWMSTLGTGGVAALISAVVAALVARLSGR